MYTLNVLSFLKLYTNKTEKNISVVKMHLKVGGETETRKAKVSFSKFNRESVAEETGSFFCQALAFILKNLLIPCIRYARSI